MRPDPLMATYAALGAADIGITMAGVEAGHTEGNPAVGLYIESRPAAMAVAFLRIVALRELMEALGDYGRGWRVVTMAVLIAAEAYMVVNNLGVIR